MNFQLYRSGLQWRWRLRAANGRIIADSAEAYINKADAQAGIALVKQAFMAPTYEV